MLHNHSENLCTAKTGNAKFFGTKHFRFLSGNCRGIYHCIYIVHVLCAMFIYDLNADILQMAGHLGLANVCARHDMTVILKDFSNGR